MNFELDVMPWLNAALFLGVVGLIAWVAGVFND